MKKRKATKEEKLKRREKEKKMLKKMKDRLVEETDIINETIKQVRKLHLIAEFDRKIISLFCNGLLNVQTKKYEQIQIINDNLNFETTKKKT